VKGLGLGKPGKDQISQPYAIVIETQPGIYRELLLHLESTQKL